MRKGRAIVVHAITDSMSTVLIRGQLAWLKGNGFDPALVCSPGPKLDNIAKEEDIPVFPIEMTRVISPLVDLRSFAHIWRVLRRIRPVICNAGTPKAGLLVGLAAWLTRVPCRIYTLRGLRLETAKGLKRVILTISERLSCLAAHRVVCVSASLQERAIDLKLVPRHKAIVLGAGSSNGVDSQRFAPTGERAAAASELRATLGIGREVPVIGFAGRLTRDKGIPELVAAFEAVCQKVPEAVLLLVGDYEAGDPVAVDLRDAIEADPHIRHVAFNSKIDLYYPVMDLFVLPTHREGFPNTVLEAQAFGLPVVTTAATGAMDSVEEGATGLLVPVGDSDKLAEAIVSLLSDPRRMQAMGRRGRDRVLRSFRNEIVWEALASLYRVMLEDRGYAVLAPSTAAETEMETPRCAPVP